MIIDVEPRDDPTLEEIAERAAAIRAEWSPREMAKRAGVRIDDPMTVPIATMHLAEARP